MTAHIFVIDDEAAIRQLLFFQLTTAGYRVTTAASGLEALVAWHTVRPDLVIVDLMLPDLSGWEICRQIRADSNLPILMLSAKQADSDIITGLESGADDYLTKPFRMGQLLARVEALLRRSSLTRQRMVGPARSEARPSAPTPRHAPEAPPTAAPPPPAAPASQSLGSQLRLARRSRGLSLLQAERLSGVRWEHLQAIEREEFSFLSRRELRRALRQYSNVLQIDLRPYLRAPRAAPRLDRIELLALCAVIGLIGVMITSLLV